ncbi:tetratricopeptide repeat protein [Nodosilinea sp. LEGE 07298]|uniref:tetratricopeptide repeat protein n=1 Tax=Nodosilinea sp. LEGE 07298 TaxID=2777970 RepID=UPI0018816394|nr:tetratricopeptide repeat protein [Nodosilinea sp. LEGE 07298]MBE9112826.1 tetratricopeptide repeat protein [Nodosilinea sp. LEGE 07298]
MVRLAGAGSSRCYCPCCVPVGRQSVLSSPAYRATTWGDRCLSLILLERYDEAIADCSRAIQLVVHRPEQRVAKCCDDDGVMRAIAFPD